MTSTDFRRLALSLPGSIEKAHMDHPDFRVSNRIFATLGYPDRTFGTVMLNPRDQTSLVAKHPRVFTAVTGAWGRAGATSVKLSKAPARVVAQALESAWRRRAPAKLRETL